MNVLDYIENIKDSNLKIKLKSVYDKANLVLKNHIEKETDFFNIYELKKATAVLNSFDDINYKIYKGYKDSYYGVIYIYPYYIEENDLEEPIKIIKIDGNFKFKKLSHRDYLGSLLSLGIKREKIGDILVNDDSSYIIVKKEISSYIINNLNNVNQNKVNLKEVDYKDIVFNGYDLKEEILVITSLRLDLIISKVYNISRTKSLNIIKNEHVKIDFRVESNNSNTLEEGNLISVRHYGRFILKSIEGSTKKGKTRVIVQKFI
ncbi:MAG: YlmH/Sll1252 family protein [Peptostreptococcaceae bacterium]|jgi:RNA-binding protein YlmH|nr:YlmH/Sll1252 family protein [Peptostreptococcaceae bacterium]